MDKEMEVARQLGELLLAEKMTIAFAESCTGGLASSYVTDISGSSQYLLGSAVTYTNEVKHKLLGVEQQVLTTYSAVSRECAQQMASGARKLFASDIGVGITGNAGPGASEGKPLGLVYIAVATADGISCKEYHFTEDRITNKQKIALTAISMVIDKLCEKVGGQ